MLLVRTLPFITQVLVNEEVGYWLARILYSHNPAKSDSAKIPGVMELFRVQVRSASFISKCSVHERPCHERLWRKSTVLSSGQCATPGHQNLFMSICLHSCGFF
jgi:hypothetical protein